MAGRRRLGGGVVERARRAHPYVHLPQSAAQGAAVRRRSAWRCAPLPQAQRGAAFLPTLFY